MVFRIEGRQPSSYYTMDSLLNSLVAKVDAEIKRMEGKGEGGSGATLKLVPIEPTLNPVERKLK